MMTPSRALSHVRQLCCLGVGSEAMMPSLLKSIRQAVPCDSTGFFWVDTEGNMTDMIAERQLSPELLKVYFERHYDAPEHQFRVRFKEREKSGAIVTETLTSPTLERSAYYNEILKPLEAHRILHVIVRHHESALGQLSLYRDRRAAPFSVVERRTAENLSRYVAHALAGPRAPVKAHDRFEDTEHEAMVICDGLGRVVQASQLAFSLLSQANGVPVNRKTALSGLAHAGTELLIGLVKSVPADDGKIADRPPSRVVETRWGRFALRAYRLIDQAPDRPLVAVLIRRQEPFLVRFAQAMGCLPLSAQQRDAALFLAQGKSNAEIAAAMSLSVNTASYHIKQLFAKLDVHDRVDAVERILQSGSSK